MTHLQVTGHVHRYAFLHHVKLYGRLPKRGRRHLRARAPHCGRHLRPAFLTVITPCRARSLGISWFHLCTHICMILQVLHTNVHPWHPYIHTSIHPDIHNTHMIQRASPMCAGRSVARAWPARQNRAVRLNTRENQVQIPPDGSVSGWLCLGRLRQVQVPLAKGTQRPGLPPG